MQSFFFCWFVLSHGLSVLLAILQLAVQTRHLPTSLFLQNVGVKVVYPHVCASFFLSMGSVLLVGVTTVRQPFHLRNCSVYHAILCPSHKLFFLAFHFLDLYKDLDFFLNSVCLPELNEYSQCSVDVLVRGFQRNRTVRMGGKNMYF